MAAGDDGADILGMVYDAAAAAAGWATAVEPTTAGAWGVDSAGFGTPAFSASDLSLFDRKNTELSTKRSNRARRMKGFHQQSSTKREIIDRERRRMSDKCDGVGAEGNLKVAGYDALRQIAEIVKADNSTEHELV